MKGELPEAAQHINAKVLAASFSRSCLDLAIEVFHRWIQEQNSLELLIDVADYRHLSHGPGVILIGHEAHYGLDMRKGEVGLLYNSRVALSGSFEQRLAFAMRQALGAALRLESEPEMRGKLSFHRHRWEVIFNDRLLVPNDEASWELMSKAVRRVLQGVIGISCRRLEREGAPRERLGLRLELDEAVARGRLEQRLSELDLTEVRPRGSRWCGGACVGSAKS